MNRKSLWTGAGAGLGMLVLILDAKTALEGAQDGIALCVQTILPSLFPFFVLSILLNGALVGETLPGLSLLGRLLRLPKNRESLLIPAFLGGYPVGTQAVASLYQRGQLTRPTARRLLSFCSNAGPAFLFGMTASLFSKGWMVWGLWGIHIASAVLTAMWIPESSEPERRAIPTTAVSWSDALASALNVTARVCGWVVLFRVLIAFLDRWFLWMLPAEIQIGLIGLLELSNGCYALKDIADESLRFVLCSLFLGFGGLCVTMQTASVIGNLPLGDYLRGKLMQTLFSLLLCWAAIQGTGVLCLTVLLLLVAIRCTRKKRSRKLSTAGV